jgi:hypothetical protein
MNFNGHTVTWGTDTIPMKDRGTLSSVEALIEVYMNENETKMLRYEYSRTTKILDSEYSQKAQMISSRHVKSSM